MTIGERIKERRIELGMSVDDLAARLGKNRATIYRYENNDIEKLPTTVLEPLAKALNTTPGTLMGWKDSPAPQFANIRPIDTQRLPVLGSVACGEPIFMSEELEVYIEATTRIDADFVLRCKGDSMTGARINDGDLVFIRHQETVENGEIAAVAIDDEAVLKRFYKYGQDLIVLRSENPAYKDMEFRPADGKQIRILGKAIAFQSDVR